MMDNIEKKLKNLRLEECSLEKRSLCKLVISLEAYFLSNCFYIQYHRGRREITSIPLYIFSFLIMFYIINTMKKH